MTRTVTSQTCPYCGWNFEVTQRHRAEAVLPYCSHGCRLATAGTAREPANRSVTACADDQEDTRSPTSAASPRAAALAEALKVHARRAFALLGADADTARARKTWAWLDRNRAKLRGWREAEGLPAVEAVKTRDLLRHEVAGVKTPADAEAVLQLLGETGHLQAVEVRPPAGKAQRLFYLCPHAFCETPPPDLPDLPDTSTGSVGFVGFVGHPPAENEGYEAWVAGGPSNA